LSARRHEEISYQQAGVQSNFAPCYHAKPLPEVVATGKTSITSLRFQLIRCINSLFTPDVNLVHRLTKLI